MTTSVYGELKADTHWEGDVLLDGDVVVPRGVTLRLAPGTRLAFASRPRWSCSVFRSAPEGYPIEASQRTRCDLVVLGRLAARGGPAAPVVLGTADAGWGGLTALGGARVELEGCILAGAGEALLQVFDDGRARLEDCLLEDATVGVLAWGLSRVEASRCVARRLETGILAREGSTFQAERTEFHACGIGMHGQHWALLSASACAFRDCAQAGAAAYDRSRLDALRCAFHACGEGLRAASAARVSARDSLFSANRVAVQGVESAALSVRGCEIEDSLEQGIKFSQRSRGEVRGCRLTGNRLAGVFSEDEAWARLAGCELADEQPVVTSGRGVALGGRGPRP